MPTTSGPTISRRLRERRGIYAIFAASGILVGAVADARPCPHHEPLPEALAGHLDLDEHGHEPNHGMPRSRYDESQPCSSDSSSGGVTHSEAPQSGAASDVHECLCVDLCVIDAVCGANPSERRSVDPVGVDDVAFRPAEDVSHPRPTVVLIPYPNAPPHVA